MRGVPVKPDPQTPTPAENPCIGVYGPGPAGERCGGCLRLRATRLPDVWDGQPVEVTVYSCGLSAGARRVTAPSCGQFEAAHVG
jgi:hypothetical protein